MEILTSVFEAQNEPDSPRNVSCVTVTSHCRLKLTGGDDDIEAWFRLAFRTGREFDICSFPH